MPDGPVLETRDLSVRYGGVPANDRISLAVRPGAVVGLIGPNGAGKTTFVDAVTGFTPSTGDVLFDGRSLAGIPPHRRARLGLTRTWQSLELFTELTVEENVRVAARQVTVGSIVAAFVGLGRRRRRGSDDADSTAALDAVGLGDVARRRPRELSLGQQKLLGVARALAGRPKVVLLDEPAAGLDTGESAVLGERLRALTAETGVSLVLIDHDMRLVLDVCDDVAVLDFGRLIAWGPPADVRVDPAVVAAYLGDRRVEAPR